MSPTISPTYCVPWFLILLSSFLFMTDVVSQSLQLRQGDLTTTCEEGLIASTDFFVMNGTVNFNLTVRKDYSDLVQLSIDGKNAPCAAFLLNCAPGFAKGCYCVSNNLSVMELYYRLAADPAYSGASVYLLWAAAKPTDPPLLSNTLTMPAMYSDVNATNHTVKVNGKECNLGSGKKSCKAILGQSNALTACCVSEVKPCNVRIQFNITEMAKGTPCATYKFTPKNRSSIDVTVVKTLCGDAKVASERGTITVEPDGGSWDRILVAALLGVLLLGGIAGFYICNRRKKGKTQTAVTNEDLKKETSIPAEEHEVSATTSVTQLSDLGKGQRASSSGSAGKSAKSKEESVIVSGSRGTGTSKTPSG